MTWLTVAHPRTRGRARIAASALPHHLRAGWTVAAGPEPAPAPTSETTPKAAGRAPGRRANGTAKESDQ